MDTNNQETIKMNIRKVVEEESKILVNYGDYDLSNDKRLLIPFIVPMNAKGQTNKIGFLNKEGEIVVEPIFDIVLPIEYDTICCFYGKGRSSTKAIKNNVKLEIYFDNLGINK